MKDAAHIQKYQESNTICLVIVAGKYFLTEFETKSWKDTRQNTQTFYIKKCN